MAASQDWISKDFYKTLGVSKTATEDEIKKAYRKLARQYHPDRNPGDKAAEEKFKAVGEAYDVLSNAEDRKQYDAIRAFGGGGARFTSGGGAGFDDIFSGMFGGGAGGANINIDDILRGFGGANTKTKSTPFGFGGGGFGGFGSPQPAKGSDLRHDISIPLRKAASGTTVKISTTDGRSITARIPAGVSDGQKIRIAGKGNPGVAGGPAGDIIMTVHVEKHPAYELRGKDVHVDVPITIGEAVSGGTISVPTLDGTSVNVKVPAGSTTGKILRCRGKGMQKKQGEYGDLYVHLNITIPTELSEDAKKAAMLFDKATSESDIRSEFERLARS